MKRKFEVIADEHPHRDSQLALTFESEIKRISSESGDSIEHITQIIADKCEISVRQIYHYRTGKTLIPEGLLTKLAAYFGSPAIISAWLSDSVSYDAEEFDLIRLATKSARQFLQTHDRFLAAFDDGRITGFELIELQRESAKSIAELNNLQHVARAAHSRRAA